MSERLLALLEAGAALELPPTVPLEAAARQEHQQALIDAVRTYVMLLGRVEGQPVPAHLPEWAHIIKGSVEEYRYQLLYNAATFGASSCALAEVEDRKNINDDDVNRTPTNDDLEREYGLRLRWIFLFFAVPYLLCGIVGLAYALASLVGPTSIFRLLLDGYHAYFQLPWAVFCLMYSIFVLRATMEINMIDATRRFRMLMLVFWGDMGIVLFGLLNVVPSALWLQNPITSQGESMTALYYKFSSGPTTSDGGPFVPHPVLCAYQAYHRCTGWDTSCLPSSSASGTNLDGAVVPIQTAPGCAPNCSFILRYPIGAETCRSRAESDTRTAVVLFLVMPLVVLSVFLLRSVIVYFQYRRFRRLQSAGGSSR